MAKNDLSMAIVGFGGDGVITMGDMIAQAAARDGLNVIKVEAYGPQIRGGESSTTVRLAATDIYAQADHVDILVVFNWKGFARFRGEITVAPDAIIFYEEADETEFDAASLGAGPNARWIKVPFIDLAVQSAGTKLAKNIVALGLLGELFNLSQQRIARAVELKFQGKKEGVAEANLKGFGAGVEFARGLGDGLREWRLEYTPREPKLLMSGNEAAAVGALHAGCRLFAGYPITPSSEVLHFLSEWMPKVGGTVVQTEDELAAIGAVIGGSFAGVKSMTATSGPGLALMTEMLGLASMAEVPAVIFDVQRGGPSTGLPTKSEQSDLWQAVFGSHGDAPRVVLAPADVEDCFHSTVDAFNIAEEYQIPVIVLSDQNIAQRRETLSMLTLDHEVKERVAPSDGQLEGYQRYQITENGVSPMTWPGIEGGQYQTNGLEHDEDGRPTSMHLTHEKMSEKRYRKLHPIRDQYHFIRRYGPDDADLGILCWGSSKGPVKEAVFKANARGLKVAAFVPQVLFPFPKREFEEFLEHIKEFIVVELSYSAQFYKYLRTFLELPEGHTHIFKRSGGKNLTVAEVEEQIASILSATNTKKEVVL